MHLNKKSLSSGELLQKIILLLFLLANNNFNDVDTPSYNNGPFLQSQITIKIVKIVKTILIFVTSVY